MATLGEIKFRVTKRAPGIDPDLLDGFVLDRYTAILDYLKWERQAAETTITTEAETGVYLLPADVRIIGTVTLVDPLGPLGRKSRAELNELAPTRAEAGAPQVWAPGLDGTDEDGLPTHQIELYPVPDGVYSVVVSYTREAPTATATSTTLLPWLRPSALVAGVTADALEALEKFQASDRQELKYRGYLADMVRTECFNRGPRPVKVSAWLTRHNVSRAMRGAGNRTGPRLP